MGRFVSGVGAMVVLVSTAAAVLPVDTHVARADDPPPVAAFDWSMPPRYGMDNSGDGLVDSFIGTTTCDEDSCTDHPPTSDFAIVPDTWHVDLDACASGPFDDYDWRVFWPGVEVVLPTGGDCDDFYAEFPVEGTFRVELRVHANGMWSEWRRLDVVVQDWLIVAMGDSYGSGEGAPDAHISLDLDEVAAAFAGLGDALADLADLGPCGPGTGFDYDECAAELDRRGDDAIDASLAFIQDLNSAICTVDAIIADPLGCLNLLFAFGLDFFAEVAANIFEAADAMAAEASALVDEYTGKFRAVYDAAAGVVASIQATIDDFLHSAAWQDRRCHRSANAGSALAAQELEAIDPRSSVTFIHVACTGAMIFQGLLDEYAGAEDERESTMLDPLPPQIEQVAGVIGERELDIVQLSIGGNDVNFGPMIFSCILRADCSEVNVVDDPRPFAEAAAAEHCTTEFPGLATLLPITNSLCLDMFEVLATDPLMEKDARTLFNEGRDGTADPPDPLRPGIGIAYDALSARIHEPIDPVDDDHEPGLGLPADRANRVFITEYVNPLIRHDGQVCGQFPDNVIPGLSHEEALWLVDEIVPELTQVVHDETPEAWNVIGGVVDGFAEGHGYCADPDGDLTPPVGFGDPAGGHWIRRLEESFVTQANKMGAVHPNGSGYRHYAQQILPAWLAALYQDPDALIGPRRPDQVPFADAGPTRLIDEGSSRLLSNDSYDGDGDNLAFQWSEAPASDVLDLTGTRLPAATVTGLDDGAGTVEVSVSDSDGSARDSTTVVVRNVPPDVQAGTASAVEGSPFIGTATFTDPGTLDTHTAMVDYDDGSPPDGPSAVVGRSVPLSHTWADDATYDVAVTVTDDDEGVDTDTLSVAVENAPPVVGAVTAPIAPVLVGTPIQVGTTFTDAGIDDTHTASVSWGDGTSTNGIVSEADGAGSVAAGNTYTVPGIYTVTVTVTDDDGGVGSSSFEYVVVYDPSGGFVTGGGVIDSPAGAYTPDATIEGPANFAFVSKYQKGATVPDGNTSFRFHAADFVFNSTRYEWLVVNGGARATYKGAGTVNGGGDYGFLLSVVDGDTTGTADRLRLKVWDRASGTVVYDNQFGAADDATATTSIRAGAITVSPPKKK